ncbi:MAG: histidinol-phosphate transaminase [Phycisphaerae bacterium]|jgi:histidinol-phosphate aminotransferase|nr:histidinol-phosphate transaminase [Phycisphaerae bacterium]
MSYFRDNIDSLSPYVPGEQPGADEKVIKLNTNENPYPPSPAAMEVVRRLAGDLLRRYPNPCAREFRAAAAHVLGFDEPWILPGNGSDELLTMLMRSTAGVGRPAAYPVPTYVLYRTLAEIQEAETIEVPFDEEYNLPAGELAEAGAALTLVASPNSPSGTLAPNDQLADLANHLSGILVIDEAYVDFADSSALDLARSCDNVVVLRTLSKGYSLAGLRLGFAVANPALLEGLSKVKDSYNVDAVAAAAGAAAIRDRAHFRANIDRVKASRNKLSADLLAMGFQVWPSQANFLLARPPGGDAQRLYEDLKGRGILVRYFKQPRLDDKLRITVGHDQDNAALIAALGKML